MSTPTEHSRPRDSDHVSTPDAGFTLVRDPARSAEHVEDLAQAIAHTRGAAAVASRDEDWTIAIDLVAVQASLLTAATGGPVRASALDVPPAPLAEHLRLGVEACERHLSRHGTDRTVQTARDVLLRCSP